MALAFTAESSKSDQAAIVQTQSTVDMNGFAAVCFRQKGLDWAADMLTSH